jgi:hypothetical protein
MSFRLARTQHTALKLPIHLPLSPNCGLSASFKLLRRPASSLSDQRAKSLRLHPFSTSTRPLFSLSMSSPANLRQRNAGKATEAASGKRASSTSPGSHHGHSHSHSPFGGHSHTHSHSGDTEEAAALAAAFSGASDKGSRIILWGLASNVALTIAKGAGGVMLHSASLLADAGHSLSDLLGDLVVLFSWKLSRRPASRAFQYGYGMLLHSARFVRI